jgi:hypothetical protein
MGTGIIFATHEKPLPPTKGRGFGGYGYGYCQKYPGVTCAHHYALVLCYGEGKWEATLSWRECNC